MDAWNIDMLFDRDLCLVGILIRPCPISPLPVTDMVTLFVVTYLRCAWLQRLERVHHHGQRFVFHLDRCHTIGGRVPIGGQDGSHFLVLVLNRIDGQHHLCVAHERGHVMHVVLLQRL